MLVFWNHKIITEYIRKWNANKRNKAKQKDYHQSWSSVTIDVFSRSSHKIFAQQMSWCSHFHVHSICNIFAFILLTVHLNLKDAMKSHFYDCQNTLWPALIATWEYGIKSKLKILLVRAQLISSSMSSRMLKILYGHLKFDP